MENRSLPRRVIRCRRPTLRRARRGRPNRLLRRPPSRLPSHRPCRSGSASSTTASTVLPGPCPDQWHAMLGMNGAAQNGRASSRSGRPAQIRTNAGLDPPRRHPGARHGQPPDARHRQQLRRVLGAAPQRQRSARDRRHRELRPAQAGGRPAGLPPLLRRHARDGRQRVRRHRAGRPELWPVSHDLPRPAPRPGGLLAYSAEFTVGGDTVVFSASDDRGNRPYQIPSCPTPAGCPATRCPFHLRLSNKDVLPEHAVAGGTRLEHAGRLGERRGEAAVAGSGLLGNPSSEASAVRRAPGQVRRCRDSATVRPRANALSTANRRRPRYG